MRPSLLAVPGVAAKVMLASGLAVIEQAFFGVASYSHDYVFFFTFCACHLSCIALKGLEVVALDTGLLSLCFLDADSGECAGGVIVS